MFESPISLIGLVLIPALIILYLLKPKPREYKIPTLMFLTDIEKREWFRSLLKRLIKDPVLLIQILIISLMVFAAAEPFYTTESEILSENIILIIDSSASMLAEDVEPNRFSAAINEAKGIIKNADKITIITSGDTWDVRLKEGTADDAVKILSDLKPGESSGNIAYSMLSARDIIDVSKKDDKIVVYVLSDFAGKDVPENVLISKSKLESDKIIVVLKKIGVSGKNTGIINVDSYRIGENKCYINLELANYNQEDDVVQITIDGEKVANKFMKADTREEFTGEVVCLDKGIEIKINPEVSGSDLLKTDNTAYIPQPQFKKVLFISGDSELKNILDAIPDLNLVVQKEGGEISDFYGFDIVISDKIHDKNKISDYVNSGGNFIFIAPETFYKWEYDDLTEILPVEIEMDGAKAKLTVKGTGIISDAEEFKNINYDEYFLRIKKYYAARNKNSTILALSEDESVLAARDDGMFYIGFNSEWTNYDEIPTDISYIAFWHNLIKSTGHDEKVVCLCNERESDIMPGNVSYYETAQVFEKVKAENKNHIFKGLLILGIIFVFFEMYYLKARGQV